MVSKTQPHLTQDSVVGFYYLDKSASGHSGSRIFAPALNPALPPIYLGVSHEAEVDAEQSAAFVHSNYRFNDRWSMTAGLRYTRESKDRDFSTNPNNLPVNQTESYHPQNGQLGWTSGSGAWTVYAWGRNLSDETRRIWNSRSFLGVACGSYTEPRTYGLAMRWNFGTCY
jgi:outer membrane receptor protein involved in Fe transport